MWLLSPTYVESVSIRVVSDASKDEALGLEQVADEPPIRELYRTHLKLKCACELAVPPQGSIFSSMKKKHKKKEEISQQK